MRRWLPLAALAFCLLSNGVAHAAYDHASVTVDPAAIAAGGGTDLSASITGKPAAVDVVFVLDNSGSMGGAFGGSTKWQVLSNATANFVEQLRGGGLFERGGKIGVVLFSDSATTAAAPTADQSAIVSGINSGAPGGESCIACGLKLAAELLTAIPASGGHRRIVYLVADGGNTGATPTIEEALAADNAAGIERRVIGLEASGAGLAAFDSDGTVAYPAGAAELATDYSAEPTSFPGATNISWVFHVAPGFAPSSATASQGAVAIAGSDVAWTIPSLGAETATLTFHAGHQVSAGCGSAGLLSGTSFSDAEGDMAPAVSAEPVTLSGCAQSPTAASVISLPKMPSKCWRRRSLTVKITPPAGVGVKKTSVKVTGRKAKAYQGSHASGKIKVTGLPKGSYKVKVSVTLDDGRTLNLIRAYRTCPSQAKR